jgi:outer membrane receptor protein involved in Fe transport
MRFRSSMNVVAAGAASFLLALPALAQTTGTLSGQVVDANSQQPVADAVVIAQSAALQGEQTAVTDATGQFEITLLPGGTYSLTLQREGYQPFTQQGLTVRIDRTIKVRLALVPEALKEQAIEIVAQRPSIAVSSEQTGANVSKEQMAIIPYGRAARNFEAVLTSVPGVHNDTFGVSINGASSPESNYIIDGVQVNDPSYGNQGTTLLQDFVQEVDVKTGGYQAEYGRSSGGIVNVVTKSGGNEFHGSVFGNWSPFEATRKPVGSTFAIAIQQSQRYNLDFGAELGGPILKDKLWFYAGFAPQLISTNIDRIIQAQVDNGTGQAKLNPDGSLAFNEVARKRYTATQTSYQFTGKLTYLANENHSIALALYGNPTKTTGAAGSLSIGQIDRAGAGFNGNEGPYLNDQTTGSIDSSLRYAGKLFNKTMLVEAGLAYHRQEGSPGYAPNVTLNQIQGVSGATLHDTPAVRWRDVRNLLDPAFNDGLVPGYQTSNEVLQQCALQPNGFNPCPVQNYRTGGPGNLTDSKLQRWGGVLKLSNFFELAGHHQFKYGVDGNYDIFDQSKYYSGGQFFDANPSFAPGEFAGIRGYGHGTPGSPTVAQLDGSGRPFAFKDATLFRRVNNVSVAGFVQDTWSIFDKVVLDAGLRWEHQEVKPDEATAIDGSGQPFQAATLKMDNIMPRLGLIYDFTGRGLSKVYTSFGRFYEYVPLDLANRSLTGEPSANYGTIISSCKNPSDPRTCAFDPNYALATSASGFGFVGNSISVDPKIKGQYTDEYQAGVQYQVYREITVGVDYIHRQIGRVIEDMSIDDGTTYFLSNPGEPGAQGASALTGAGLFTFPKPRRVYDGITLSVNKNLSDNYLIGASYTYSSFRGNYPGLFKPDTGQLDPNITSEFDLISLLANRDGPLPGDIPNSFKVNAGYIYELNPRTSFNIGTNLTADQGVPTNYLGAHPIYGSGEGYVLPRGSGNRLPWLWQLDLRGAVNYKFTKDYTFALSLDVFNVTNNRAVTAVDENYTFNAVNPIVNGTPADLPNLRRTNGQPITPNANFDHPTAYQRPLSARLGAKLAF